MKFITLLLISFLSLTLSAQSNPFLLAEPQNDVSFTAFKKQLAVAIEKRDTNLLKPLLADSILESRNGLCRYCDKAKFISISCRKNEKLPYSNEFWEQAERLVKLGFTKSTENNPDYYANIVKTGEHLISPPYDYHNSLDSVLVLEKGIFIRKEPLKTSKVVTIVNHTVLPTVNSDDADDLYDYTIYNQDEEISYIRVRLKNNETGYLDASYTSQAIYKQITIAKQNGQWKIVSFYHPPSC
jgi:hypothetical protein